MQEHADRSRLAALLEHALHGRRRLRALLGVGRVDVEEHRLAPEGADLAGDALGVGERRLAVEVDAEDVEPGAGQGQADGLAEAGGGAQDQRPAAQAERARSSRPAGTSVTEKRF